MTKLSHRQILIAAAVTLSVIAVIVFAVVFQFRDQLPSPEESRKIVLSFLGSIPPVVYFLAFVILPALGMPLSLFYLTAIPVLGTTHTAIGVLLAWTAVALNMSLANILARSLLHPAIEWVIKHRNLSIPKIKPENEWKIVLTTRLSPIPFFLQNYLLALGHARWRTYLGISMIIQASLGLAVMLVGESILSGGLGYVLLALFIFLLLHLLLDNLRKRLKSEQPESK